MRSRRPSDDDLCKIWTRPPRCTPRLGLDGVLFEPWGKTLGRFGFSGKTWGTLGRQHVLLGRRLEDVVIYEEDVGRRWEDIVFYGEDVVQLKNDSNLLLP